MAEEQNKLQKLAEKKYRAYRTFFTTEEGEDILSDLMKATCYQSTTIGADPYQTYYNEGRRSVVLQIIQTAKLTPKQIKNITDKLQEEDSYYLD